MNQKKPIAIIESLAFLSVKHSIFLAELFQAIVEARKKGKTNCQELTIEYRGSIKHEAILLITKDTQVVGQFRVAEEFFLKKNICFENWLNTDKVRRQISRQNASRLERQIRDLRHGMKKVNLEAEVIETTKPTTVQTQWGNSATVTNAWIADETGKIKLCLWNELTNIVNVGDTIQIQNATVSTFKGERQLHLGKVGTVNVLPRTDQNKQQLKTVAKNTIKA
ncbi:MAG: hypothetical protein NWF00_05430 [Candidatus Bathyarchaeota archaeon]|nr:hypothetical protein [Candidatus Bathyarchaeota archaeon]